VSKAFDDASEHFGVLHGAVLSAGIVHHSHTTPLVDITAEEFDDTCAINLRGSFLCVKHAARHVCCVTVLTSKRT
jgi:NAD(P)-dependent dehydrogenase (short-subunit alcohol dehydrogenase family)